MPDHNHIDSEYLDQIFPEEKLTNRQKQDALLYAMGTSLSELAELNHLHVDTVRKQLNDTSVTISGCSEIKNLRTVTLIRLFNRILIKL